MAWTGIWLQCRYALKAYRQAPMTWLKRACLGRDPYWRQYCWSRWGWIPSTLRALNGQPTLWVDAQSLGEVNQLTTLLDRLQQRLPAWRVVISTNEPSSFQAAHALAPGRVFDEPWDLPRPTRRVFRAVRPRAVIVVEHPQNPIRLVEARRHGIRTLLISADFPPGWERLPFMRRALALQAPQALDAIAVKTEDDAEQYVRWGALRSCIEVVGDLKYDLESIERRAQRAELLRAQFGIDPSQRWLVGGSVHLGEEEWLRETWQCARATVPGLRLVLVPRWAEHGPEMAERLRRRGTPVICRSAWTGGPVPADTVVVVDTYGELVAWYALAWAAWLGGSAMASSRNWTGLCHTPVEPLALGVPVFVGPNHHLRRAFFEGLQQRWPGFCVQDPADFAWRLTELARSPALDARLRREAREMTDHHRGVVDRYVDWVIRQLPEAAAHG